MRLTVKCILVGSLFLISANMLFGVTLQVGNCKKVTAKYEYSTIQAAITAAASGATIDVCPGTYAEQLTISHPLSLKGLAVGTSDAAVITAPAGGLAVNTTDPISGMPFAAQIWVSDAIGVDISDLAIDGANNGVVTDCSTDFAGIYYENASGTVTRVALRNQMLDSSMNGCNTGWGMFVISSGGSSTVTISNSTIHNYQKGGIVANEAGTTLTATGNTVLGMGSATGSAQNGIQIGFGATGAIKSNYVADHDWYQSSPTTWSASGILLWGAPKVVVSGNTVVNNQTSIVVENVDTDDLANGTTLTSNHVYGSHIFDAIDVCSNDNTVSGNQVNTADAGGIHIDSECPVGATASGTGNIVKSNTINDACAGLLGDATGNTFGSNTFYNTTYTTLSGDVCPPLVPTVTGIKSLAEPMGLVGGAQSRYVPSPR